VTDFTTRPRKYFADRLWNHAIGAGLPTGFTARMDTTDSTWAVQAESAAGPPSDKEIKATLAAVGHYGVSLDSVGQKADLGVIGLVLAPTTTGSANHGGVAVRMSGSAGSENCYYASLRSTTGAASALRVARVVSGTDTLLANFSIVWTVNTWYFIRLRAFGTAVKAKIWAQGAAEPTTWGVEATDANVTGAGYAGFYARQTSSDPAFAYVAATQNYPPPTF
jgi:hypothetical protein